MAKIDRLGWTVGIAFRVCGLRLGVRVNDPAVLPLVLERLPPGWIPLAAPYVDMMFSLLVGGSAPGAKVRKFNLVYLDSGRLARSLELGAALESLEQALDFYVSAEARTRTFVHAGAVALGGKALIIPGRRNTGKTTLVAELVRQGATYYSDDHAVLDARGRVHPYPRALAIYSERIGRRIKTTAAELGGSDAVKPLPVSLVVASEYREGAHWRARELSPGQAVLTLLANTVSARRRPEVALATLESVVARAVVLKSTRGEAKEAASAILEELTSR
jgi:serine kinase of HPr protein (carbohydrate metabolism regulator)